uniref:Cubilin n=1 Tax=Phallusia mammillata TaxID=59560 RepID=A0A6F9DAD0_9ASCI|nr:cubilin [Phallusia mammillata]
MSVGYYGFNASYQQGCGGFISSDLGAVESPNFPNQYPPNTYCVWDVVSTLGSNITLTFDPQFGITNSDSGCDATKGDSLQLLNGRELDAPPLTPNNGAGSGFYCGSSPPQNLQTQANGLMVIFKTDASGNSNGFRFTFSAELGDCGSLLSLTDQVTSGTLSSPNYPSNYPTGIDCYWIIQVPATEAVQLDFTSFNVEVHSNCDYDYVLVLDGRTGDGAVLGKFCGNTQPPTTKSTSNEMTIRFRSDPYTVAGGFQATYSIAACGGTLVGTGGKITSPEYPSNYPLSTSCSWVVRGPAYHFLSFDFDMLDLATSDSSVCGDGTGDYIEFRTFNFTGPLLATVCGNTIPDTIDTVTNVVYITFVSDGSDNAGGFNMSYLASEDACGADLNNAGGAISSPNYPNAYDHARTCTWNIVVAVDRRVTLTFNAFAVEDPYEEDGVCYWDYIEVFNGVNPNSPSLRGRICGAQLPSPFESSGNTMRVVFVTDASVSNGGFLATYSSTEPRICGGLLNSQNGGFFTTPNYPKAYDNSMECLWTIANPNNVNSTTLITFTAFAVENHIVCDYDYVSLRAGATYDGYPVGTYCGHTKPDPIPIASPQNFVQFISDPYVTDTGFNATYRFTRCGGFIGGSTDGVITTPNYPSPYDHDDYCLWTIAVVEGHKVNLLFTNFTIELHNSCLYDYLKIFNGPTIDSPLVDTYCGTNKPTQFQSGSNTVTLLFQSDFSVSTGGFRVEWSEDGSGCGNIIFHDHAGSITSPNYPNNYPRNSNCIWQMFVDPAYHLDVTFDDNFNIEYNDGCLYDYVAFYDGSSEFSPEITRFCGVSGDDTAPDGDPVKSSIQYLTVRFRSDFSTQHAGFKANWEAHCGLTITSESGTIQSPNYPSAYNHNEYCEFLITYDDDFKFIMLTFSQFDVEAGSGPGLCDYDFVKVYGGSDKNAPLLGTFCGSMRPNTPLSSEGSMLVVFSSDPAEFDYGFRATYESSDCGGMLTASSGSINAFTHSDIHNNRNCTWQIEISPAERLVEFKFSTFDLEAHSGCQYDYVKIYDGIDTNAPLIGTYCGNRAPSHVLSTANQMTVEYITDDLETGNGFTAGYRAMPGPAEGCGGTLTGDTGTFTTPDLDNSGNYDANLNCVWLINSDVNKVVTVEFTSFKLENESSPGICGFDHVDVRDGSSELNPLALVACGLQAPSPFISSTNQLFVRFVSDPYVEDTGFVARYSTSPTTCGGTFLAGSNYLTLNSPPVTGLPQALGCRWTIDAGTDKSKSVMINFLDLNIQSTSNQGSNCAVAYVELRDLPLGDYGQVRRYCGSELPEDFISLDQIVQVNLRADVGTTGSGFKLQYKITGCSRDIIQPYGQLFSPGWPDPLAALLDCQLTIKVPEDQQIQLFFNYFDVEYEPNCEFDYVLIRNGSSPDSPVIKRLCGNYIPDPVFVMTNEVFIQLVTDPYIEGNGYDITYTSSNNSCGGIVVGDHGSVYSTLYPQPYQPNTDCGFSIRTPAGRPTTIHITFIDVYLECGDNGCYCVDDLLYIYGGPDINSPLMSAYCGYGTLTDLKSPTNGAYIRLKTTDFPPGSRSNAGFRVDFES